MIETLNKSASKHSMRGNYIMKSKVAFICVHNSCRSQMAGGLARHLGSDLIESYSAGTEEYVEVKPLAVEVVELFVLFFLQSMKKIGGWMIHQEEL